MLWGTLPLASTQNWGFRWWWVPQGSCSAGWWAGAWPSPSTDHCPWGSTPMGTVGFEVCRCLAFKTRHGWDGFFLHAGCHVTPQTVNGFARVLLCWHAGLCRAGEIQVTAFCLWKGTGDRERGLLLSCVCLSLAWVDLGSANHLHLALLQSM